MSKPARLYKKEPLTVQLTPMIILAGTLLIMAIVGLGLGFNDSYSYLLGGI